MKTASLFFLMMTLLAIFSQALFALFEMAAVSFNKVRLQYYVARSNRRAMWLKFLLDRPSRLFGATLIGVNASLQIGSECSRRFYEALGMDPDFAPLTQVFLVVIFAELAPLFAARRHPETLALFFVPLMVLVSRILSPLVWAIDALSRGIHRLMGKKREVPLFLSREEVRMAFEERERDELSLSVGKIFQLKTKKAFELMEPLKETPLVSSQAKGGEILSLLEKNYHPFFPLYHRRESNIVGIVMARDFLHFSEERNAMAASHSPWFVLQDTSILEILDQFRSNNQRVAVILNLEGEAIGFLSLEDIFSEVFGEMGRVESAGELSALYVDRTLDGEMLISDFNREFHAMLPCKEKETLSDLIFQSLEHPPVKGEAVKIGSFVFTVIEPTLMGAKILFVRSLEGK